MKFIHKQPLAALLLLCVLGMSYSLVANILVYPFDDPVKEERFNNLAQELRCPKCQNNNLADSNSGLALDLKNIIYEQINAGRSDAEIVDFLKQRYGDFITYRPPVKPGTWLIWFGPFVFLLVGFFAIFRFVSKRSEAQMRLQGHGKSSSKNTTAEVQTTESTTADDSRNLLKEWKNEIK